jgi:hypothetical protein
VERASHNLKIVITTYEGKHNHDVPKPRNIVALPSRGANVQASGIPKSETHQTLAPHFDRNEFLRSSLMGSFSNDMKYSSLNSIIPYGRNPDHVVAPQVGPIASIFPEIPMPIPMNLPSSENFSLPGINFNYAQPMSSVQSYLSGQLMMDINTGFQA